MSEAESHPYRPQLTRAGLPPTHAAVAVDAQGNRLDTRIAGEAPLTLYVDKREIVTLMTLGTHPEALTLGYLHNQQFIDDLRDIRSVQVDWETHSVSVVTRSGTSAWEHKLAKRTVTTGCGQGTVFGDLMDKLSTIRVRRMPLRQSTIYRLLQALGQRNDVYRAAGGVHGCALCNGADVIAFVEDVGRHNAADAVAGMMWLNGIDGADKLFYTTGRLTSEMVIKVTQMGIPVLLSRSSATHMGLELARRAGVTLIARAKGKHFLVFNGAESIIFDDVPLPAHDRQGSATAVRPGR